MTREVKGFLAMVPPTVTHNDLRPALRAGRPYIRKSDRLRDAEAALEARLIPLRPHDGPLSGPLLVEVRWCFPAGRHAQGEPHTDKPDMSNMLKTLEDCMVRTGWIADDRMICQERTAKAWMDPAGIWVRAAELA